MIEFFIALFGGAYWIYRFSSAKIEKKRDAKKDEQRRFYLSNFKDKYFADRQLLEEVERYVRNNLYKLQEEFHDDLVYIYGRWYKTEQKNPNIWKKWYYNIPDALKFLILARDYKKIEDRYVYSAGFRQEQTQYSIRLFKRMNEYIEDAPCQLTMYPQDVGIPLKWSIYCARFKTAAQNTYANYPEAKMESWSKYC